jgi:hypothetical protein
MNADTLGTLSGFPSWLSMPALPVAENAVPVPQALMAIDLNNCKWEGEHHTSRIVIEDPKGRARMRSRPRSYHQVLGDFITEDQDEKKVQVRGRGTFDVVGIPLEEGEEGRVPYRHHGRRTLRDVSSGSLYRRSRCRRRALLLAQDSWTTRVG